MYLRLSLILMTAVSLSLCQDANEIIRQDIDGPHADGSYKWAIQTGGGIYHEERGGLKPNSAGEPSLLVEGQYQYTDPTGKVINVLYTAGEHGFEARGDHIPTPPPIPPAIQRALDYLATKPPSTNDY